MADGLNDARAMRIAEVMNNFRSIQLRISQLRATAPAQEFQEMGYAVLRQCQAEAQAVLSTHFDGGSLNVPTSSSEQQKRSLQRVLLDASARRFRGQRIYLRATAAMRWVQNRQQVLKGRSPQPVHTAALRQIDNNLRTELAAITDSRVYNELRAKDQAAGHWMGEMADLNTVLNYVRSH